MTENEIDKPELHKKGKGESRKKGLSVMLKGGRL